MSASAVAVAGRRFVLRCNAGSGIVTVFKILWDISFKNVSINFVPGLAPVSIAINGNLIYVASADVDGGFDDISAMKGQIMGFKLTKFGRLV